MITKWEYKTKKISVMLDTDDVVTDARIQIELDGPGAEGWELVSVVDEPSSAHVRAFYKRKLSTPTVLA